MGGVGFIELAILLVIYLLPVLLVGYVASEKGRSAVGWGLLAFFFTPVIGIVVLLIAGDKP